MREILFRGQTRRYGEKVWMNGEKVPSNWVYGGVMQGTGAFSIIYGCDNITDKTAHSLGKHTVYTDTLGQYTGLTDKNGKKIFEGDIVAGAVHWLERMKNGVVAFKDGSFGLIWYRGEVEQFNPFTSMCNVEYEVIGNIHDNKLEDFDNEG